MDGRQWPDLSDVARFSCFQNGNHFLWPPVVRSCVGKTALSPIVVGGGLAHIGTCGKQGFVDFEIVGVRDCIGQHVVPPVHDAIGACTLAKMTNDGLVVVREYGRRKSVIAVGLSLLGDMSEHL